MGSVRHLAWWLSTLVLSCSSPVFAQVDTTYRIVAHYDTQPASVAPPPSANTTALGVLKTYASASALEAGFVSVKVLTDIGRSSRFEVVEVWASQAAHTAHRAALAYATLQTAIAPWLVGPVEEIAHTHFK